MILGYLKIEYISKVLPYDDEIYPLKLAGKKMLPIIKLNEEKVLNESIEIILKIDKKNVLNKELFFSKRNEIEKTLDQIASVVHPLAIPYWYLTPEFDKTAGNYFRTKKEMKRGSFCELVQKSELLMDNAEMILKTLEENLNPFFQSTKMTLVDLLLAAHLWGLYIVPEYNLSIKLHKYLQKIKKACNFSYHEDFWERDCPQPFIRDL